MSDLVERRDYQIALKEQTYAAWNRGEKNVLNVLPTGGGKSVIMSDIVLDGAQMNLKQCVIAHRNELVAQMSAHIGRRGIEHRIIGSDKTINQIRRQHRALFHGQQFVHPTARTSVIGVDTLVSRQKTLSDWAFQHDRWMCDEAHHLLRENKWGKAVSLMPNAFGSGFTATPCRADGQGLGREFDGVFDVMNIGPSMRTLISRNYLCDYEVVCPRSDMMVDDVEVGASGDWSSQTLRKAAKKSRIVGDTVENYVRHAMGRRAIVFATDIETANSTAVKFNEWGIRAAALSSETPDATREFYIEQFKSGALTVLINVDLFDEGFDVPACDVVIMARPTASLGKYRQMVGRALRYVWGKIALIIDMVSNIIRHKLPDFETIWTLGRRDKRGKQQKDPNEIPLRECKNVACLKPYEAFRVVCPHCGTEKPLPEPRSRTIEQVEGDYILLDRATLEKMRQATVMESPGSIAERVATAAGPIAGKAASKRQFEKIEAHAHLREVLAQWAGIERARGFDDREIARKFYLVTGMDVVTALDASRPRSEMDSLRERIESWWRK
jgi:superfamily II DNA or RNA helicase